MSNQVVVFSRFSKKIEGRRKSFYPLIRFPAEDPLSLFWKRRRIVLTGYDPFVNLLKPQFYAILEGGQAVDLLQELMSLS